MCIPELRVGRALRVCLAGSCAVPGGAWSRRLGWGWSGPKLQVPAQVLGGPAERSWHLAPRLAL